MNIWLIISLSVIFSAFFSGVEIAFVSSNKLKIELDKNKGTLSGVVLSRYAKSPSLFITTLLLGNNIALVIYGMAMSNLLSADESIGLFSNVWKFIFPNGTSQSLILVIQTIISTIIILIFAEFIPKAVFRINPNRKLSFFAILIQFFSFLFYPFAYLYIKFSEFILKKILRVKFSEESYQFSASDLDNYIKEIASDVPVEKKLDQDVQILQNALDFKTVKLRECMIPRTEIEAIDEKESMEVLLKKFIDNGFSKILVYQESIDHIIGFVHSNSLFEKPKSIKSYINPVLIVPETMLANDLMTQFIKERMSIAIVVDEFGGTSGMLTLEDVIEEIFGEIHDEFDSEDHQEEQINKTEFIFSSRLEIDYLNDKYKIDLPESEEYETLGGLVIKFNADIPAKGEKIEIGQFHFEILEATSTRIEKVKILINEKL